MISPDVTSACFADIVVGHWRGATHLVTDITTQQSQTGTESAPKSSHILFRYASKISERNRVWPVGKYFHLHIFFLLRPSIQILINFVFEQAGKRKFKVFSFLLQPIEQWKCYVILKDILQLVNHFCWLSLLYKFPADFLNILTCQVWFLFLSSLTFFLFLLSEDQNFWHILIFTRIFLPIQINPGASSLSTDYISLTIV